MKACTACGERKPLAQFYADRRRPDGAQPRCKECMKAYQREHRAERREWENKRNRHPHVKARLAGQQRERRAKNPEAARANARQRYAANRRAFLERSRGYAIKWNYGLTVEEYDRLLAAQVGRCAICRQNRSVKESFRLGVDHDHDTGAIRGLLCSNCNVGIGHFWDSPDLLRAAAVYLERMKKGAVA